MMNKKTVGIKELKANHPSEYNTHYQKYCTMQWEWPLEEDSYVEGLNYNTNWLDVDHIHYNVSYSQGNYAYFTGKVLLDKFLEEFDTENEYFVLREAMKLKDCENQVVIGSSYRGGSADFSGIEWAGYENWNDDAVVQPNGGTRSILEGMNYGDYYATCEELMGDLETWVKGKCESMFSDLYYQLRNESDYQMSEEAFEELAESMDEQFEVEVDDDEPRDADHSEDARLAA